MSTYPCVKCGRIVNVTMNPGATDFYDYKGMYFCSTSCRAAWRAEHENTSSSSSMSKEEAAAISARSAAAREQAAADREEAAAAKAQAAAEKARAEAEDTALRIAERRRMEAADQASADSVSSMNLPDTEEGLEDFVESMINKYKSTTFFGDDKKARGAIAQQAEAALRRYRKLASSGDYRRLNMKWKKVKITHSLGFLMGVLVAAVLILMIWIEIREEFF